MMMECPKCGFVQPKDQYCANCGIDTVSFKPQRPSLFIRMLNSSLLQVIFIVVAVASLVFVIFESQRRQTLDPMSPPLPTLPSTNPKPESPIDSRKDSNSSPISGRNDVPAQSKNSGNRDSQKSTPQTSDTTLNEPAPSAFLEKTPTESKKALAPSEKILKVLFGEIPLESIESLLAEASSFKEDSGLRAFTIKSGDSLSALSEKLRGVRWLPGRHSPSTKSPMEISYTFDKTDGSQFGVRFQIESKLTSPESIDIEIESQWIIPTETDHTTIESRQIATLPKGTVLIIVGGLPHKKWPDTLIKQIAGSPLQIVTSPQFLSSTTDLVTVVAH